jgi:hypothetical protein
MYAGKKSRKMLAALWYNFVTKVDYAVNIFRAGVLGVIGASCTTPAATKVL